MPDPIASGVLIAFEGIDGSGKTTQAALLRSWAEPLGFEVVSTKEPTAGPWGKKIRDSMFTKRLPPDEELAAFVNDRREHVETLILPALRRGALVVVDRYYYSTVAYQGARGLDPVKVLAMNRQFAPIPDLVFLFDLDPKVGLERITRRGAGQDLFETLDELTKARNIFHGLAKTARHLVILDAQRPIEQMHREILSELVRGPLFARMPLKLKIPDGPPYELLKLAQRLALDPTLVPQEKARQLWTHANDAQP